jgi:periplasmic mercuric ion binding protein
MNLRVLFLVLALAACSITSAQDSTVQEAQIKVFGNCGMCKTRIEKAVAIKEVKYAKWNKSTKILRIAFRSPGITLDSLEQRIAAVGHDTEKFKAPDEVYASLPACCLYRNGNATH